MKIIPFEHFLCNFFCYKTLSISLMKRSWNLLKLLVFHCISFTTRENKKDIYYFLWYLFVYLTKKILVLAFKMEVTLSLFVFCFCFPPSFLSCFRGYELQEDKVVRAFFLFKVLFFYGRLISCPTFALIYTSVIPTEGKGNYCH